MTWRIELHYGSVKLAIQEDAESEVIAIYNAQRYARALGYSGHPDRTYSKRVA